uniref:BTB domain-containing protein n=1 Tax=Panagrellus redivivus TaxID=6233 RepID=A0A7E4V5P2_PANRE
MQSVKDFVNIKDAVSFTLNECDLKRTDGYWLETAQHDVQRSNGLRWWIRWYPAGRDKGRVSVFLWVNKPVMAKFTFAVDGSTISWSGTNQFRGIPIGSGCSHFRHEKLRPIFRNGILTMTCSVEFNVELPFVSFIPRNFQLFDHMPTDMEIVVGCERVPVHKYFLLLISPVFNAMFSHNTVESKSGRIKISDFDYDTVKAAIDLCYGRQLEDPSVDTVVSILRFTDKYFITPITNEFERLLLLNLSTETFGLIVHYAYDCNKDVLLAECCNFFKEHQSEIKATEQFAEFPPALAIDMMKSAFNFKTDFDVLRHAHKNGIAFVVKHLEQPFLKQIYLQNFCSIVDYAWECSRDELKNRCAEFFNSNISKVMNLEEFHKLPAVTMSGLMTASYTLKNSID